MVLIWEWVGTSGNIFVLVISRSYYRLFELIYFTYEDDGVGREINSLFDALYFIWATTLTIGKLFVIFMDTEDINIYPLN